MEKNKKHTYLQYALLFLLFTGGGAVAGAVCKTDSENGTHKKR